MSVSHERPLLLRAIGAVVQVVAGAAALLVLVACLAAVVKLTLTPSPASVGIAHTNLRPGATIRLYLQQPSVRQALLQIGGNVLVGVPFGLALPVFAPRFRGVMRVLAATLVVVGALEVAQHFFVPGRSFDVDDIILALVGALAGYLLAGRRLSRLVHPRHRHAWQRYGDRLRRRRAQQT